MFKGVKMLLQAKLDIYPVTVYCIFLLLLT